MSWGVNLEACDNWKGEQGRKEWPTRKGQSGKRAIGQRKSPKGIPWGLWWVPSGSIARKGR